MSVPSLKEPSAKITHANEILAELLYSDAAKTKAFGKTIASRQEVAAEFCCNYNQYTINDFHVVELKTTDDKTLLGLSAISFEEAFADLVLLDVCDEISTSNISRDGSYPEEQAEVAL